MQTKHVPVGPAGVVVLSAGSLGEVELGSAYSLQSKDGGRLESRSISFTWPDLRGSRVKTMGDFLRNRMILEVSVEFRVEVRSLFHENTSFLLYMVFSPNSLSSI